MKFQEGQQVTLLNTEYKPVGNATIRKYEKDLHKYIVEFVYPDGDKAEDLSVPEERLMATAETAH